MIWGSLFVVLVSELGTNDNLRYWSFDSWSMIESLCSVEGIVTENGISISYCSQQFDVSKTLRNEYW